MIEFLTAVFKELTPIEILMVVLIAIVTLLYLFILIRDSYKVLIGKQSVKKIFTGLQIIHLINSIFFLLFVFAAPSFLEIIEDVYSPFLPTIGAINSYLKTVLILASLGYYIYFLSGTKKGISFFNLKNKFFTEREKRNRILNMYGLIASWVFLVLIIFYFYAIIIYPMFFGFDHLVCLVG